MSEAKLPAMFTGALKQTVSSPSSVISGDVALLPDGLTLIPDFISAAEEKSLLEKIDSLPWSEELRRKTQQYGSVYKYARGGTVESSRPKKGLPFPEIFTELVLKKFSESKVFSKEPKEVFDQCIVNEYLPGQGITPHTNDRNYFGETICSLSMNSEYVMDFDNPRIGKKISIPLPRRSMLVLTGEARHNWRHSIASRLSDPRAGKSVSRGRRVSITFRIMKGNLRFPNPSLEH